MRTKHMVNGSRNAGGNPDIISTLPDNVLGLIASFLPMKDSVATCTLSWRWRYVWTLSPVLDFDFSVFPRTRRRKHAFADFVERSIDQFSAPELRKFRFSLEGYGGHEPRLDAWISFAARHEAQQLELCLPKGKDMQLPASLSDCGSITALTLKMHDYFYELPSPERFTRLEKLHLQSTDLRRSEFFGEVCEHCSRLEDVTIDRCRVDVLDLMVAPALKSLTISNCTWASPSQIRVSAASLSSFSYSGCGAAEHVFENMGSLKEVVLDLRAASMEIMKEQCLTYLVRLLLYGLRSARVLKLSSWCAEVLSSWRGEQGNVRRLALSLERKEDCVRAITSLLTSFPNVVILELHIIPSQLARKKLNADGEEEEEGMNNEVMILRNLKSVKLECINESRTGIELIKFLLKYARNLEDMKIVPSSDGLELAHFKLNVWACRKASRKVHVEYP